MKFKAFSQSNKFVLALVLLNVIVGIMLLSRWALNSINHKNQGQVLIDRNAGLLSKDGVMPRDQYVHINEIARSVQGAGGKISDQDLDYYLGILRHNYSNQSEYQKRHNEKMLLGMLMSHSVTAPTAAQRDALFGEFKRAASSSRDFPANISSFQTTAIILARSHDQRIAPVLLSMLNYPNRTLQDNCGTWLRELGYSLPSGTSGIQQGATARTGTM